MPATALRITLALALLGCGAASPPASAAETSSGETSSADTPESDEAAEGTTCALSYLDGDEVHTLDAEGRTIRVYQNSDAAGAQWQAEYRYDARGRRSSIRGEMIEGIGDLGPAPEVVPTYEEDAAARTVLVRYPEHYSDPRRVRWTYDERGFVIRREWLEEDGVPFRTMACEYDARGRVITRGDTRFTYDDGALPVTMDIGELYRVISEPGRIEVRSADRPDDADEAEFLDDGELRFEGTCHDLFFGPCSPNAAPPPPGRERSRLPRE